jgi:hypothetical protein
MPDARCQMPDARCQMPDARRQAPRSKARQRLNGNCTSNSKLHKLREHKHEHVQEGLRWMHRLGHVLCQDPNRFKPCSPGQTSLLRTSRRNKLDQIKVKFQHSSEHTGKGAGMESWSNGVMEGGCQDLDPWANCLARVQGP